LGNDKASLTAAAVSAAPGKSPKKSSPEGTTDPAAPARARMNCLSFPGVAPAALRPGLPCHYPNLQS